MSCVLRIYGESLDVDAMLSHCPISPDRVWKKGEPRISKDKFYSNSGASFLSSGADLDEFDKQVVEAISFLDSHSQEISGMVAFSGVEAAVLDFGVSLYEGYVAQSSYLPPRLIQLASKTGIGVQVSHYVCSKEDEEC
jgi:hypothetical protein